MAVPALVLLCLNGIAAGADAPSAAVREGGRPGATSEASLTIRATRWRIALQPPCRKTLRLFGYEIFATAGTASPPAFGTAQSDYLLGPGDEVRVTIRGGKYDSNRRYTVNSNGDVIVDQLRPLTAAGRTLGDLRRQIERVEVTMSATRHSYRWKGCGKWASS